MDIPGKAIIISAPSGAGKTTIIKHLMEAVPQLEFSVSACTRDKRAGETHGKDYFFISPETFREHISRGNFVEWEEVYDGSYYGTLKSELERIWEMGRIPLFEVDIKGGLTLKEYFGNRALSIFISPPSVEILEQRLRTRGTDNEESLRKRIGKAAFEMTFTGRFDAVIVNDDLQTACSEIIRIVSIFISQ
jgi:guanylate kinase